MLLVEHNVLKKKNIFKKKTNNFLLDAKARWAVSLAMY